MRATPVRGLLEVPLAESGSVLIVPVRYWSVLGHHDYGDELWLQRPGGGTVTPVGHRELVALLLSELEPVAARAEDASEDRVPVSSCPPRRAPLIAQIEDSVACTTRYLHRDHEPPPTSADPRTLTRHAEQSLCFGHPFHPTPKSAEGFSAADIEAYAPELRACFRLHYLAVAPSLLVETRCCSVPWVPAEVQQQAAALLPAYREVYALLPVHPWQFGYLSRQPAFATHVARGGLVPLGPLGQPVYPTSSVRTVCDPGFATCWKLPLHVRITNFVRTNPLEHARRAVDAGRLIKALAIGWAHQGFEVLLETGYRTIDDPVLAADLTVLYRDNPFSTRDEAPLVVASLLEEGVDGAEPEVVRCVRQAGDHPQGPPPAEDVAEWLRRYLEISLLPLLAVFAADGVSLEAHVQNSLVHLEGGWPVRFYVRDMEGTSVSRQRLGDTGSRHSLPADSPLLYEDADAWLRLKYYVVTNHLGHLVAVLGRHTGADESRLWRVVRELLRQVPPQRYVADLLTSPVLPAKANLISRFAGRGERPLWVDVPNPLRAVHP